MAHNTWQLAHVVAGVSAAAELAPQRLAEQLQQLQLRQQEQQEQQLLLARMLPLGVKMFQRTFRYSDSNLCSIRSTAFKAQLLLADGRVARCATARCYVLDVELPRHLVIGAHVFKHEWAYLAKDVLDIDDVDDVRNGLLLYRPLEWAFDTGRLVFVLDAGALVLRVLDPAIRELSLHAKAAQLLCKAPEQQAAELATLESKWRLPEARSTFGALHETRARLLPPAGVSPWRRCLCFHAHVARREAVRVGWIATEDDAPFDDYWSWSEESEAAARVRHWLEHSAQPLHPVSEDSADTTSGATE